MKTLLWLDDTRNPFLNDWLVFSPIEQPYRVIWVKSYEEFVDYFYGTQVLESGFPDAVCFDHDLGEQIDPNVNEVTFYNGELSCFSTLPYNENEKTGYDCAKFLVEHCMNNNLPLPKWNIQSANPIGKENIKGLLENYEKHYKLI